MIIHKPTISGSLAFAEGSYITGSVIISGSLNLNGSNVSPTGGSTDITLLNSYTASQNTKNSTLSTYTGSVDTKLTAIANSTSSLNSKTGSYATTGSNIFQGNQTITGSLYITQDLVVGGSASINYISQSSLNIGTNVISVNTFNPAVRFGGFAVSDSGSATSGSLLFDSQNNQWVFVHQASEGASVTSSVLLMGPQSVAGIGNEEYPTINKIIKSLNAEHLGDSNITDDGTTVSISTDLVVTGSLFATASNAVTASYAISASHLIGGGGGGMTLIDTQTYSDTGSFTWTKPAGAKLIQVILTGGGGGGASGAAAVGSGVAGGTGGGGGGGTVIQVLTADLFDNFVSGSVGAGGIGGTANSRIGAGANATTAGNPGNTGATSSFGYLIAEGGIGGAYTAANNAVGAGGAPAIYPTFTFSAATGLYTLDQFQPPIALSGPGGSGAATDKNPTSVAALSMSTPVATGGGYGGTPGSLTVDENGGDGGTSLASGSVAGGTGGTSSTNGGTGNVAGLWWGTGGGGGFGDYIASGTATASNGGNGVLGGGGGGGGSARVNTNTNPNTANGGAGGNGGNGIVIVYTYG